MHLSPIPRLPQHACASLVRATSHSAHSSRAPPAPCRPPRERPALMSAAAAPEEAGLRLGVLRSVAASSLAALLLAVLLAGAPPAACACACGGSVR